MDSNTLDISAAGNRPPPSLGRSFRRSDQVASVSAAPRIKKIPPLMRKERINFSAERSLFRQVMLRLEKDPTFLRSTIQYAFILLCLWIGFEFHLFVKWGMSNGLSRYVERPPGVEGFLPISGLISLKYWVVSGILNEIHPASVVVLLGVIATSLVLRKAFCSWLCPVGTVSESLWMLGEKVFGRTLQVPRWLDYPLRTLKYLLLFFFVYSIWHMNDAALNLFIYSPYNKVADVKMYLFFAEISTFALWTIIALAIFSVVIKNFWCRYLCPYGALLGIVGWISPMKVTRSKASCIDCELCTKACPSAIKVHKVDRVWSDECTSCLRCVEACPVKNTLEVRASKSSRLVPSWVLGVLVAGVFMAVTGLAMLTGHWQNRISNEEYLRRIQNIDSPVYQHFRGEVPAYGPND